MLKSVLRNAVPQAIRNLRRPPPPPFALESFAQEGEDMVLRRFFEPKTTPGFYVDIGAHHPQRFSNTYFFYRHGWRGINVDAMPGSMTPFKAARPLDRNIEAAISLAPQTLTYFVFNEPALNTLDPALAAERESLAAYRIVDRVKVRTRTLADLLGECISAGTEIDFMSVDVEGFDLEVLQSNDWTRFRPTLVLAEDSHAMAGLSGVEDSDITRFLKDAGYSPWASTGLTVFYRRSR